MKRVTSFHIPARTSLFQENQRIKSEEIDYITQRKYKNRSCTLWHCPFKAFKICDIAHTNFTILSNPSRHKKIKKWAESRDYLTIQTTKHLSASLKNLSVGKFFGINLPCCRRILSAVSYYTVKRPILKSSLMRQIAPLEYIITLLKRSIPKKLR